MVGSHPDLVVVATSATVIPVKQARELALTASHSPALGRWRIIVIEDADRLTEQAANALLRVFEEPPPRTVWLLCAPSLEDLLITVRSRCRHLRLRTPPVAAVAELLQRGPRPLQPPFASYVGLVERRGEPCRIGEAGEGLAPRALVRRGHEHAIHVEDRRRQRHGLGPGRVPQAGRRLCLAPERSGRRSLPDEPGGGG